MQTTLNNKKIVIIGGTSGLGFSAMKAFLKSGAQVVSMGLPNDDLPELRHCSYFIGDARKKGEAEKAILQCVTRFGGFDALYHVAGGSGRKWGDGPLHQLSTKALGKTINCFSI